MTEHANGFAAVPAAAPAARNAHGSGCLCGVSRRRFLKGVASTAFGLTSAAAAAQSPTPVSRSPRIDVHHHMLPPRYIEYGRQQLLGNAPAFAEVLRWTPERTLETMGRSGIDTAMISLSQPGLRFEDIEATRGMIRYCNEYGAQMVRDYPGRFGLFATLPLTDVDGSLREIEYAFDVLKADGVGLLTSYGDKWPGHPTFDPIFEELNRRKTVAFFHPNSPACCINLIPDVTTPTVEYLFNTARTITSMLFSGTFSRFPDLKCIFCHSGGAMTPQVKRVARLAELNPKVKQRLPNGAMAEIRKLFYDTAQSAEPENLGALMTLVPDSQILFGTDYPYLAPAITIDPMEKLGLREDQLRAFTRDNALRLFPRLRA
jgi:predicted TIM-barrel fold metal-dependent hydrolase